MKLKYIIASLATLCALATGCKKAEIGDLEEFQVNKSYISLPQKGGSDSIVVTATVAWSIDTTGTGKWLKVDPIKGDIGETKVIFTAKDSVDATQSATLLIQNAEKTKAQYLNVTQKATGGSDRPSTCAEVLAGPTGKTYKVKGVVKKIVDAATYGNWYIGDETGEVYVYGTKDEEGQLKQGALLKYGIEVGDSVYIEGPKDVYNTTVELKEVTILSFTKSLIKVVTEGEITAEAEQDTVSVRLLYKGNNLDIAPDVDWLSILSIQTIPATGKDIIDTTQVNFIVAPNDGKGRTGNVVFSSSLNGTASVRNVAITQLGGNMNIEDIELDKPAHVIGTVTGICKKGVIVTDKTASILFFDNNYVAGTYALGDQLDIKCSKITAYNRGFQLDKSNVTKIEKVGTEEVVYPTPSVVTAAEVDAYIADTENRLCKYISLAGEVTVNGNYVNITVPGTTNQGSGYQVPSEIKDTLQSGKVYEFTGYSTTVSGSSVKYLNILITGAKRATKYTKATEIVSGKSYLFVFADTLALNTLPSSKTYGYPSASPCKVVNNTIIGAFADNEHIFTAVEGGYNMTDGLGRYIYLYKDGGKSFNVAASIPATPANCGVWSATFDAEGVATVSNVMDNSWIQYNPSYSSAGSYKTAQSGAILPVLYEKQ